MALLTTAKEYAAVREAIQTLTSTGQSMVSFTVDGMSVQYSASQLPWLEQRERTLAGRMTAHNVRKRVTPDFSGGSNENVGSGPGP
jgi:hypothetical protein